MFFAGFDSELEKLANGDAVEFLRNRGRRKKWLKGTARERFVKSRSGAAKKLKKWQPKAPRPPQPVTTKTAVVGNLARMAATGAIASETGVKTPSTMMLDRIREGGPTKDSSPAAQPKKAPEPKLPRGTRSYTTPKSSNVAGYRYNTRTQELHVTYKSGGTYKYTGVPPKVYRALRRNKSAGKTVHKRVKGGGYDYEKVSAEKKGKNSKLRIPLLTALTLAGVGGGSWLGGGLLGPIGALGGGYLGGRGGLGLGRKLMPKKEEEKQASAQKAAWMLKAANGDMMAYFQAHPEKLKEYRKRQAAKERYKNSPEGRKNRAAWRKRLKTMAKKAGAVKKTCTIDGITMRLEYEKGDTRFKGAPHERKVLDHYGHMPGTFGKGADGEAIDIYVNPTLEKGMPVGTVYKVRQLKKGSGEFDEDKYMVGYGSGAEAKKAFLRNMPSWAFGSMSSMSKDGFCKLVGQPKKADS